MDRQPGTTGIYTSLFTRPEAGEQFPATQATTTVVDAQPLEPATGDDTPPWGFQIGGHVFIAAPSPNLIVAGCTP